MYTNKCVICGKEFESESKVRKICYDDHYLECPYCGVKVLWNITDRKFTGCKSCNRKNAVAKRKKTMMERYGAETTLQSKYLKEKVKATNLEKYGVDNPTKSKQVRLKTENTNLKKYGFKNVMSNPDVAKKSADSRRENMNEIVQKIRQTFLEKYGYESCFQSPEIIDKIDSTFLEKYGVRRAIQVPEFRDKMKNTMQERYGVSYYIQSDEYRNGEHAKMSKVNQNFKKFIESKGLEVETEFNVGFKCYDFRIKDSNILLEINPTYTHNIFGNHWSQEGLSENYHKEKTELAESEGFRCINVWDWDDWEKIYCLIQPTTRRIYARKCSIFKINKEVGDEFLTNYHIQGTCRGQILYVGLVYEDELVQLMTFGKSRFNSNYDTELLRMCTKPGTSVIGGASKLFHHVIETYELSNIISYCDKSKFLGSVYEKIGMDLKSITPPQEIWSKDSRKITANLLRSRGYDQLFGTYYGKGTSNDELMIENGWLPVCDCGQKVYVFDIRNSYNRTSNEFNETYEPVNRNILDKKRERLCAFCNEPFIPASNRQIYCKRKHYRKCPVCGNMYLETNVENLKRPPIACSQECRSKRIKESKINKQQ